MIKKILALFKRKGPRLDKTDKDIIRSIAKGKDRKTSNRPLRVSRGRDVLQPFKICKPIRPSKPEATNDIK